MELMPQELKEKFKDFPLESQDGKGLDAEVVVKYFYPYGRGTWLITEGEEQEDGYWELFGYCHIYEWKWGSVMLSQLKEIQAPWGGGVERDLYIGEHRTVKELIA